jgi:hypothetical protein
MELKDTIPIIFNSGAYGTYLEWCLFTLTSDNDVVNPLLEDGSSHQYKGQHLLNISGWKSYVDLSNPSKFVRFHPKTLQTESIKSNLELVLSTVEKIIFLYPDSDSTLLNINNTFSKIGKKWWPRPGSGPRNSQIDQEYQIIANKLYNNWPANPETEFDDIPNWIKREFLSLYLMPMWFDQVEWFFPNMWTHNNCQVVLIKDLLYNFENTLQSLKEFLKLSFTKEIAQLLPTHKKMLADQQNIGQDALCNQIVNSTVNNINFSWQAEYLSLPSESWIQWKLRELGFELACNNLNRFPTNNIDLKQLIYKI